MCSVGPKSGCSPDSLTDKIFIPSRKSSAVATPPGWESAPKKSDPVVSTRHGSRLLPGFLDAVVEEVSGGSETPNFVPCRRNFRSFYERVSEIFLAPCKIRLKVLLQSYILPILALLKEVCGFFAMFAEACRVVSRTSHDAEVELGGLAGTPSASNGRQDRHAAALLAPFQVQQLQALPFSACFSMALVRVGRYLELRGVGKLWSVGVDLEWYIKLFLGVHFADYLA